MYRITETTPRGVSRIVCETGSRETCARLMVTLIQRDTLPVLVTRNPAPHPGALGQASRRADFVERPALAVVMHALDPRWNRPATFNACGHNGAWYKAEFIPPAKPTPSDATRAHRADYPRGTIDLTRLSRDPSDTRGRNVPSEAARAW
jgi:hypothetical protein